MATRIATKTKTIPTTRPTKLLQARNLLVEGWTKGTSWTYDEALGVRNYCMTGALNGVRAGKADFAVLARVIDPDHDETEFDADVIVSFNDKKETHLEDVLRVFNQAIRQRKIDLTFAARKAHRRILAASRKSRKS